MEEKGGGLLAIFRLFYLLLVIRCHRRKLEKERAAGSFLV